MKTLLLSMAAAVTLSAAAEEKTVTNDVAANDVHKGADRYENLPLQADTISDNYKNLSLHEVVVSGVRTQKDAPFAVANIKRADLAEHSVTGKELPFLFARTPGVLAWSENGLGTGTTYMRIRGAADSRINVTLDGVPLNSPEDQCVFWANMNSYASLLGSVQIQRGVGTSTNGDGAFGGTISLATKAPAEHLSAEVSSSYGSYGTYNLGGAFSTGLLWNQLIIDAAYHETNTSGYIHGTSGRSGSYYGGITWRSTDNFALSYKNIGNFEKTGQAWNGVVAGNNDYSLMDGCYDDGSWTYQTKTGIKSYKDMYDRGLGRFNSLYEQLRTGDDGLFVKDADGNYLTDRYTLADGTLWDKTTDNFWQNHNLLNATFKIDDRWTATATLHYTHGQGYYQEFRPNNKLSKFGLTAADAEGKSVKRSDFIRRKGLKQDTYGVVGNANYKDDRWNVIGGLSLQNFKGEHYGYLKYASNPFVQQKYLASGDYKYFGTDASKLDGNVYLKAAYRFAPQWQVFADMQYRHVGYKLDGLNDKFYQQADGTYRNQPLAIDKNYDFFNPKAGLSWSAGPHHAYASVAISHREPEVNNFTDNGSYPAPSAEQLTDYELGYNFSTRNVRLGANIYYMDYTDQFVHTGAVSDIGEALTTNIKDSYRLGVELTAAWDVCPLFTLEGNVALSRNKLKDFTEMASVDWESDFRPIHYDDATLAFSPSAILNGFIDFHWRGLKATWHTNFVSRQYLDNTENCDRSLPAYSATNLHLSYTVKPSLLGASFFREAVIGFNVGNLFDRHYASSGWVYSSILEDYGHPNENRYYQIGFIPMAGRTFMGTFTLRF